MSIKPALTGNDLRMAGYRPGPLFLEMLRFICDEYDKEDSIFRFPDLFRDEQHRKDIELYWLRTHGYKPR